MYIKSIFIAIILIIFAVLSNQSTAQITSKSDQTVQVDYFADNGYGNAVAVVQHPAGIYHKGITYLCYQGPKEDPYVASYNHQTKEWKGPYKAGISEMGKDPTRKKRIDNHGKPSIMIDNAGYIHIAFGGHGGMKKHGKNVLGNHHYGKNAHAVSKKPLDISSWETLDNIPPFGTYNQFVKMDNGDIYLFYRHGAHRSDWVYQISTDNGRTFSDPISFLKHKRRVDQAAVDSWYPWITKRNGDELMVVFDYHLCNDNVKGEKKKRHVPKRYNVYYMSFNTKTGQWKNISGEILPTPLTREVADVKTRVAETSGEWTFQGVVTSDIHGNPYIGITVGDEIKGAPRSAPKQMQYFRWDGEQWLREMQSGLPISNGDIEIEAENSIQFYLVEKIDGGLGEVAKWEKTLKEKFFKKTKILLSKRKANFAISSLIENPHPDARFIVAEKKRGTDFRKMYLIGDQGPIMRPKNQADILSNE